MDAKTACVWLCVMFVGGCAVTAGRPARANRAIQHDKPMAAVRVSVPPSGKLSIERYGADGLPLPTRVFPGGTNQPDQGYAVATGQDGAVIVVWYERAGGRTQLSVRRAGKDGHVLWTRAIEGTCALLNADGRVVNRVDEHVLRDSGQAMASRVCSAHEGRP